jgi:hypothetical protein
MREECPFAMDRGKGDRMSPLSVRPGLAKAQPESIEILKEVYQKAKGWARINTSGTLGESSQDTPNSTKT